MTLGADDVTFSRIVEACVENAIEQRLDSSVKLQCTSGDPGTAIDSDFFAKLPTLRRDYTTLADWIVARGRADHLVPKVVFTTYYDPLPTGTTSCPDSELLDYAQIRYLTARLLQLNSLIVSTVDGLHRRGVGVVNLTNAFDGHRWCSAQPWAYGLSIFKLTNPSSLLSQAPFHPTPAGQEQIARLVGTRGRAAAECPVRARGGRAAAGALAVLATLVVPTGWAAGGAAGATPGPVATPVKAPFSGHGSIDEAYELGAVPGTHLVLYDAAGRAVGKGVADRYGSLIVPSLRPGPGYRFGAVTGGTVQKSAPFKVLSVDDTPPESFYADQHLHVGLNYITMRDGITLAATVRLPPGKTLADGPFPTVHRVLGLRHRRPRQPAPSISTPASRHEEPACCPTRPPPSGRSSPRCSASPRSASRCAARAARAAPSTCSACPPLRRLRRGADRRPPSPGSDGHKVGLVGISFSGISQLFVAGTRPPGLAAIAPMSPTNDLYATGLPRGHLQQRLRRQLGRRAGRPTPSRRRRAASPTPGP